MMFPTTMSGGWKGGNMTNEKSITSKEMEESNERNNIKRNPALQCMLLFEALDIIEKCLKPQEDEEKEE